MIIMADKKSKDKPKEKATVKVTVKEITVGTAALKPKVTNVYSADFSEIDNTLEKIKKEVRKVCQGDYSSNNCYLILEEALKKIVLANH
tara:strand:+ start:2013 stop:2279 length:267 start_codon:yes stop_codon:yes gene_type:complete